MWRGRRRIPHASEAATSVQWRTWSAERRGHHCGQRDQDAQLTLPWVWRCAANTAATGRVKTHSKHCGEGRWEMLSQLCGERESGDAQPCLNVKGEMRRQQCGETGGEARPTLRSERGDAKPTP
jgi:hypothetical protein